MFDYLKSRKRPVVIAIDEFQQVRKYPESGTEALLRSYIQFLPNVHFIFSGSQYHLMTDMFVSPRGPFYNSTDIMSLTTIDSEKYLLFARSFFESDGRKFDDDTFRKVYSDFDGITWYIQSVLNRVWQYRDGLQGDEDVEYAVRDLIEDRALVFHDLFASQPEASRALLKAIAAEGVVSTPTGSAFLGKHHLGSASTVASAAEALIGKEILYKTEAGLVVYDRLMGRWLYGK